MQQTEDCNSKQVVSRQAKFLSIHQNAPDCFEARILLFGISPLPNEDDTNDVRVELTTDELFKFREFQKAMLREFGVLIFNQAVEADGVSSWPYHLTTSIKDHA